MPYKNPALPQNDEHNTITQLRIMDKTHEAQIAA
jgi:hypothetical protein